MKVCRNSSFLRKFKYILSGSFLRILFHSFIHLYVSYFPVIGLSTFPCFLKLLCITYNIAINLIPKINCSVTKPLLEVRKLYPLSCVSFILFFFSSVVIFLGYQDLLNPLYPNGQIITSIVLSLFKLHLL